MIYLTYQFNKVTYTVCDDVAQWDTNQVMKISNLPHYCTYNLSYSKNGNIITTETYLIEDSLIPFPNECFFEAGSIHCYIQREQDGETETIADILINVKERSIPSNTQPCDVRDGKLFVSSEGVKQGTMPEYNGETLISPSKDIIVLKTSGKFIENDITIEEIPEKYIEPSGTKTISKNGIHDVKEFESVDVHVETATLLQEKTVTPTKSAQDVTADKEFEGLSTVHVDPIPDEYVVQKMQEKTVIPKKSMQDVTADEDYTGLSTVHVEPIPDEYIKPEGSIEITENGTFDITEKAEVNVQVVAKPEKPYIDSSKLKYFAYMFSKNNGNADLILLENLDTSNGIDFTAMFKGRNDLIDVSLDAQNGENFYAMFDGCSALTNITLNSYSGKNFNQMCRSCSSLKNINIDTSNGETFRLMFQYASVETVPELDLGNATDLYGMYLGSKISGKLTMNAPKNKNLAACFASTTKLSEIDLGNTSSVENWAGTFDVSAVETISCLDFSSAKNIVKVFSGANSLKNITFKSIPIFDNNFSIQWSPLTEESLASLVNALSDNSELDTTYTVTLGSDNLAKLTEEQLAIVAAKNINLA